MEIIIKRDGSKVPYDGRKIAEAMRKAFQSTDKKVEQVILEGLVIKTEAYFGAENEISVEKVQDLVERVLMENGHLQEAKNYILYRGHRNELRFVREELIQRLEDKGLEDLIISIQRDFGDYDIRRLDAKYRSFEKKNMSLEEQIKMLTKAAVELTSKEEPKWEFIAARILYYGFRRELKSIEEKNNFNCLYDKILYLADNQLYGRYIIDNYTKAEIDEFESYIEESRNNLFTYSGLDLLLSRYIIKDHKKVPFESPQEMFLGVAMHLAMQEPNNRNLWVKKFYDMMSLQQVTMATPTFANARKPYHQLSSCFIDTVPDSLDGIYHSVENFARISKFGGGMGMYLGKIRANGSSIRGFEGAAGGVIRWIKVINDTAVAVDQLGVRQGAVAVYLDAWHKDLPEFLQLRTNNGDDRMKAHDVFPAICYPDLFWKKCKEDLNQDWYLMCPHEIKVVKGYSLEDFYGEEWERRYADCVQDHRISKRTITVKDLVRLIIKSAVETGTPFAFNRDIVNEANPNKHRGIIYCSNLCTEIAQNMSAVTQISETVETENGRVIVVKKTEPGDFVVCNLASLCLGNIDVDRQEAVNEVVSTVIRALDNVIDLNYYPLDYARLTSTSYRSIGLGVSGYHHMLAKHQISWESDAHLIFADRVFERINYAAVKASNELAKERGSYDYFEGSEWQNGLYFERRNYNDEKWKKLKEDVANTGMRNAYLLAIAPTSSTSIIIGTSAGLDPIMHRFFLEEKKGAILPRVAPELSAETYWYYQNAHSLDQKWSVRANGVRSRHVDQASSFNLYITNEFSMRELLNLYILAYESGVKTIYYVRSKSLEVEECENCAS